MKTKYFLKHALVATALLGSASLSAQLVRQPNFIDTEKPVIGAEGPILMDFGFECAAAWGDYNNDGYLDLITVGSGHSWSKNTILYKNNGDGTFTKVEELPFPNMQYGNATWFDYDNDGNLDLFIAGRDDVGCYSGLWRNLGSESNFEFAEVMDGKFEYIDNGGGNNSNRYVLAADYDNDGWVDLFMHGKTQGGERITLLYKNMQGQDFEVVEFPVTGGKTFIPVNAGTAAWGDYDNDGFLDLLYNGKIFDGNGTVDADEAMGCYLYRNNGDGTFAEPISFVGTEQGDVDWFDYNNDGLLDFIITGVRGIYMFPDATHEGDWWDWKWYSSIYENNGDGNFREIPAAVNGMPGGKQQASIALGDINNDGFEDVLYMNAEPNSFFLNNYADETFTKVELRYNFFESDGTPKKDEDGTPQVDRTGNQWGGTACLVDYDNDNDLDIFTIAYGFEPKLSRNDLNDDITPRQAPSAPTNVKAVVSEGGIVNFTWDFTNNDNNPTPAEAIKYNLYISKDGSSEIISVLPANLTTGRLKVNETLAPIVTKSYTITGLADGNYTFGIQAIDNAKVASTFTTSTFNVGGSSIGKVNADNVNVFAKGNSVMITSNGGVEGIVTINDISGKTVYNAAKEINNTQVALASGVYVVKVATGANAVVKKVIVK